MTNPRFACARPACASRVRPGGTGDGANPDAQVTVAHPSRFPSAYLRVAADRQLVATGFVRRVARAGFLRHQWPALLGAVVAGLLLAAQASAHQAALSPAAMTTIPSAGSTTGMGGESSSFVESLTVPGELFSGVVAASQRASSVRVVGLVAGSGATLRVDLKLTAGSGGEGTIDVNGVSLRVIRIGSDFYLNGDSVFWKDVAGAAVVHLFADRWVEDSATSGAFASLASVMDMRSFVGDALGSHEELAEEQPTTVDGQPAIALIDAREDETLDVAGAGAPYPLEDIASQGAIRFEAWNQSFRVTAPTDPVDFSAAIARGSRVAG